MDTRSKVVLKVAGVVLLASVVTVGVSHKRKPTAKKPRVAETADFQAETEPTAGPPDPGSPHKLKYLPKPVASTWPVAATPSNSPDESSLMSKLHALGETNPALSLQLAREGNQRFPASAQAPERSWMVCKSLVNMRRFEEARDEAKVMVEKYPNTPWTTDIQKHLLVNPLTHPAERGYGKAAELE